MGINIVFFDLSGGIKSVSQSLLIALSKYGLETNLINLREKRGGFFVKLLKSFLELIFYKRTDVFILQHFFPITVGLFLRCIGYKNIINVVHTDLAEYYSSSSFYKKIFIKTVFFLLKNEVVVFVSYEACIKAKSKFGLKNSKLIYNIYNFNENRAEKSKKDYKFVVGSISRLHKSKNIDLLIRVIKNLPDTKLLIYGIGNEEENLRSYIRKQGCENTVELVGLGKNKEKMYLSIDALVSFSEIEGFPTTILEAIDYSVPIFHTDCNSGARELMSDKTNPLIKTSSYEKTSVGYLVKPKRRTTLYTDHLDDYEIEYVKTMESFIEDVKSNNFSMSFDKLRFSNRVIAKQWLELINSFSFK